MYEQKKNAQIKMKKAKRLADRCLVKQQNVTQLQKALSAAQRASEDLSATLDREKKRYV